MTQISTGAKEIMEDAILIPSAVTLRATSTVRVNQATPAMDASAQVTHLYANLSHVYCSLKSQSLFIFFFVNICRYTLFTREKKCTVG